MRLAFSRPAASTLCSLVAAALAACSSGGGGGFFPPTDGPAPGGDGSSADLRPAGGPDGGDPNAPVCSIVITPKSGGPTDTYVANVASTNATSCSYARDQGPPAAVACNGSFMGNAAQFGGPGLHVGVITAAGPGGSSICSQSYTISGGAAPPTCDVQVTPKVGKVSDTFNFSLTSTGASTCNAVLDGQTSLAVACNGSMSFPGNVLGTGSHTAVVTATGTTGSGKCSVSFQVNP